MKEQKPFPGMLDRMTLSPKAKRRFDDLFLPAEETRVFPEKDLKLCIEPEQRELLGSSWYALQRKTDKRSTLLIVEGSSVNKYTKGKNKEKWALAFDQAFATRQLAQEFVDGLGLLWSLEDPNKVPRRQGGPQEVARLDYLSRLAAIDDSKTWHQPLYEKEIELVDSIYQQFLRMSNALTPKQWELIWTLHDRVVQRQERRKAQPERERG